ncbi:cysteine-rich receptor-like protein kinase [Tanacetum coccineum]
MLCAYDCYVNDMRLGRTSSRLAKVIGNIISPNQTAFLSGRQILDEVLIANEIVNVALKSKLKVLLLKVDFEKAFNSVSSDFLIDVMKQMGFGHRWCEWIKSCLQSATVSVLVNGSPTKEFRMERGLRQGDLLSPFLFINVAEVLHVSILDACGNDIYNGLSLANDGSTYLYYNMPMTLSFLENGLLKMIRTRCSMLNDVWGGNWEWCSSPRGRTLDEVSELSRLIGNLVLTSEQQDGCRWNLDPNGKFTVNNLSKLIDIAILGSNVMSYKVDWNRFVPKK